MQQLLQIGFLQKREDVKKKNKRVLTPKIFLFLLRFILSYQLYGLHVCDGIQEIQHNDAQIMHITQTDAHLGIDAHICDDAYHFNEHIDHRIAQWVVQCQRFFRVELEDA